MTFLNPEFKEQTRILMLINRHWLTLIALCIYLELRAQRLS